MTSIEWTRPPGYRGESWNPTVGCRRISAGCGTAKAGGCYAEKMAARLREMGLPDYQGLTTGNGKSARWTGLVRELPHRLAVPLTRKAPTCWFVDSMSDLFHEDVSDEFIASVFGVMAATPQHRYIILTKRAERLPRWFESIEEQWECDRYETPEYAAQSTQTDIVLGAAIGQDVRIDLNSPKPPWPLPNVVIGVSVEDQATADDRIPYLLQTPAACRMVSYEPALEAVDFGASLGTVGDDGAWALRDAFGEPRPLWACRTCSGTRYREVDPVAIHCAACRGTGVGIGFVVVGGESGTGARSFNLDWARSTIAQCSAAGVPVFCKQLGPYPHERRDASGPQGIDHALANLGEEHPQRPWFRDGWCLTSSGSGESGVTAWFRHHRMASKKGNDPAEWPADLRVRQWPAMLMDRAEAP